jgi:hypothetical protein
MSTRTTTIERPAPTAPPRPVRPGDRSGAGTRPRPPRVAGSDLDGRTAAPYGHRRAGSAAGGSVATAPRPPSTIPVTYAQEDEAPEIALCPDPDPALLCANLAVCVVEILAGARSLDQVGRWVTDSVYIHLLRRTVLAARARAVSAQEARRPRFHIGDPLLSYPSDDVVEGVVLVHQPSRSRAIALRLERHRGRWRATALSIL